MDLLTISQTDPDPQAKHEPRVVPPTYFQDLVQELRAGKKPNFSAHSRYLNHDVEFARELDAQDPLRHLRDHFVFPPGPSDKPATYLCGNSLGLQPKIVKEYLNSYLETWSSLGVEGHFTARKESLLVPWEDMAEQCAKQSTQIVGALPHEIVIMNSLTVNLHLLLASFYRPTKERHKIILEKKAFPSDQYAIQSHLQWHGLDPASSMVEIAPPSDSPNYLPTAHILSTIDAHADETAVLLLPGVQYYTGQLFDIPTITAHARSKGIVVGWDLAHAVGNAELALHEWDVDFAAWCTYKYLNAGPGAIGGVFVHERHGKVENATPDSRAEAQSDDAAKKYGKGGEAEGKAQTWTYRPRLAGWYGNDKTVRFDMASTMRPTLGAAGFQVSNPSALDLAALSAALGVFQQTTMRALRDKSLALTAYAEALLDELVRENQGDGDGDGDGDADADARAVPDPDVVSVITPRDPGERGAQLSILLRDGVLDRVMRHLKKAGVVCDERKPNVIRVAPVPMYNTFQDVWEFVRVLRG